MGPSAGGAITNPVPDRAPSAGMAKDNADEQGPCPQTTHVTREVVHTQKSRSKQMLFMFASHHLLSSLYLGEQEQEKLSKFLHKLLVLLLFVT